LKVAADREEAMEALEYDNILAEGEALMQHLRLFHPANWRSLVLATEQDV
jgi:hypothetical protein